MPWTGSQPQPCPNCSGDFIGEVGTKCLHCGCAGKIKPKVKLKDRLNLYLQTAHLQATNLRRDAIEHGDRKGRWHAEGKRDAIEELLKKVNEDDA